MWFVRVLFNVLVHCNNSPHGVMWILSDTRWIGTANSLPALVFLVWVRVALILSLLSCPIMCLYIQSSVLWCSLRFPHKTDVRFVICVCLCIVVSCTYWVVFLLYFLCLVYLLPISLDCSFLIAPLVYSNVYSSHYHPTSHYLCSLLMCA